MGTFRAMGTLGPLGGRQWGPAEPLRHWGPLPRRPGTPKEGTLGTPEPLETPKGGDISDSHRPGDNGATKEGTLSTLGTPKGQTLRTASALGTLGTPQEGDTVSPQYPGDVVSTQGGGH